MGCAPPRHTPPPPPSAVPLPPTEVSHRNAYRPKKIQNCSRPPGSVPRREWPSPCLSPQSPRALPALRGAPLAARPGSPGQPGRTHTPPPSLKMAPKNDVSIYRHICIYVCLYIHTHMYIHKHVDIIEKGEMRSARAPPGHTLSPRLREGTAGSRRRSAEVPRGAAVASAGLLPAATRQ